MGVHGCLSRRALKRGISKSQVGLLLTVACRGEVGLTLTAACRESLAVYREREREGGRSRHGGGTGVDGHGQFAVAFIQTYE